MSYQSTTRVTCETLQDSLNTYFQTCEAGRLRRDTPFLDFLLSDANRSGLGQTISPGQGRHRNINLTYTQRILETDVLEDQTNPNCTATTKRGNCSQNYSIDTSSNVQVETLIDPVDFDEVCQTNEFILQETLFDMQNALMRKLETKIAGELPALVGVWGEEAEGVTADVLQVRTRRAGAADEPYAYTTEEIDRAIEVSGYCDNTVIFGGQTLYSAYRQRAAGCCADYGVDIRELWNQYANPFVYSKRVSNAFSAGNKVNENVVIQRGSLQLLTYTVNPIRDGFKDMLRNGANGMYGVIVDPQTGMNIDFTMTEQLCGGISIIMTATAQLEALPNDLFPTGDEFDGVSFTGRIQVSN